jgi:hypothetical protein
MPRNASLNTSSTGFRTAASSHHVTYTESPQASLNAQNGGNAASTTNQNGTNVNMSGGHNADKLGQDVKSTTRRKKQATRPLLACPIAKHHQVHNLRPTCGYKGGSTLSHVTIHLGCNQHLLEFPFVVLCRTCWEHVIDLSEWQNVHVPTLCTQSVAQKQVRGTTRVVEQWQNLYLKMFPNSQRLPNPCKFDTICESVIALTPMNRYQRPYVVGFKGPRWTTSAAKQQRPSEPQL